MYLNNKLVLLLVAVTLWPTISANHKDTITSTHIRNSIANAKSHSNTNSNSGTNGGIYFSDIPLNDEEGSADGPDDDLDDNASGKGEDDEDTKDIIDKEGSGTQPITGTGSDPDTDTDDSDDGDLELGSGDESLFISSTERPTKRPEVTKTPVTTPKESKEPKKKDPIPDPIEENIVPDVRPPPVVVTPETSTKYMVPSSTHWPPHRKENEDDDNQLTNEVHIMGHKQVTPASFFARPGILAAVIGGAVVGLLCAILLVMFIVYRMRKKDEGSYALDEPKRPNTSNPYARGASKEFYA